ncbi:MAG: NmrA/HSCARG family protein [Bauldia sp.]|nr:NmrA/HSCARG family protein [Bauldia sp.]
MSSKRTVFVTGATGQQGGAVARALLARGHKIRALTRNPSSDAAKALAKAGVDVREGDFNHPATLTAAATGVDTAFVMSTPFEAGEEAEVRQGIAAIDAIKATGVGHVIYSSVASADKATGIPHFDSKYAVEQHLAASGLNYTISAPVWFMDNLFAPWMVGALRDGTVAIALDKTKPLQQVAVEDIGAFVATLAERREAVFGKRYDIASDELTGEALTSALSEAANRAFNYFDVPLDMVRQQSEDLAIMFAWFDKVGYSADIEGLRRDFPEVKWHRFSDWARSRDWNVLDAKASEAA